MLFRLQRSSTGVGRRCLRDCTGLQHNQAAPCQIATTTCLLDSENSHQHQVCVARVTLCCSTPHHPAPKAAPKRKEPAANGATPAPKEKKPRTSAAKEPKQAKVYDLPGQTRDTPEEARPTVFTSGCTQCIPQNDPLRKFYTSLLEQVTDSAMARKWCVMHGLLSAKEAQAWVDEFKGGKGARCGSNVFVHVVCIIMCTMQDADKTKTGGEKGGIVGEKAGSEKGGQAGSEKGGQAASDKGRQAASDKTSKEGRAHEEGGNPGQEAGHHGREQRRRRATRAAESCFLKHAYCFGHTCLQLWHNTLQPDIAAAVASGVPGSV